MEEENWCLLRDFPNYSVSDHGRVRRIVPCKRGPSRQDAFVKQIVDRKGYSRVGLSHEGVRGTFLVHRLVAMAFGIPRRADQTFVAHNDGNPQNNHVSNLRWATPKENSDDMILHGTRLFGDKSSSVRSSKLDAEAIREIRRLRRDGKKLREIGEMYSITSSHVCLITTGATWKHVA